MYEGRANEVGSRPEERREVVVMPSTTRAKSSPKSRKREVGLPGPDDERGMVVDEDENEDEDEDAVKNVHCVGRGAKREGKEGNRRKEGRKRDIFRHTLRHETFTQRGNETGSLASHHDRIKTAAQRGERPLIGCLLGDLATTGDELAGFKQQE